MTDEPTPEQRAEAEEFLCDLLDYAQKTGLPSPNIEDDIEKIAALIAERDKATKAAEEWDTRCREAEAAAAENERKGLELLGERDRLRAENGTMRPVVEAVAGAKAHSKIDDKGFARVVLWSGVLDAAEVIVRQSA